MAKNTVNWVVFELQNKVNLYSSIKLILNTVSKPNTNLHNEK